MKILKHIFLLLTPILLLWSCSRTETVERGDVIATSSNINTLPQHNWTLSRPAAEADTFVFRMSWSKAKFAYENGDYLFVPNIKYIVEMDLAENNFAHPVIVAETEELYHDFYTKELKTNIDRILGEESVAPKNYEFRVKAITEYGESISAPAMVTLASYYLVDPFISNVYIIGDMNGWDPNNKDYIMFRNSNDYNDGTYNYTGYFKAGTYFKMVAEEDMGGYDKMFCAGDNGKLVIGDLGAFYVAEGFHTITVDIKDMTWKIENFDGGTAQVYSVLGPIGGFCGWDNEPLMTQSAFDPHQWRITYDFSDATAIKFRANRDWSHNWGGNDADIPYGKAVFDGPGATIKDAGNYDIYFNDLTGHYVIKKN